MTIQIPLRGGGVALVDDCDAHLLTGGWFPETGPTGITYACRKITIAPKVQVKRRLHRLVLGLTDPKALVDHRNGDGLDCRRENLLICSPAENQRNRAGPTRANTSGYIGVVWHPQSQKWRAQIRHLGRTHSFGLHDTKEAAYRARLAGERQLWGDPQPRRPDHS